jgi:hypothetical protein
VAVLGCGIEPDYPRSHVELALRIREQGAVVSEYPPGVERAPWRFSARNRTSLGTVRVWLNHALRPRRRSPQIPPSCGLGVVLAAPNRKTLGPLPGQACEPTRCPQRHRTQPPRHLRTWPPLGTPASSTKRRASTSARASRFSPSSQRSPRIDWQPQRWPSSSADGVASSAAPRRLSAGRVLRSGLLVERRGLQ